MTYAQLKFNHLSMLRSQLRYDKRLTQGVWMARYNSGHARAVRYVARNGLPSAAGREAYRQRLYMDVLEEFGFWELFWPLIAPFLKQMIGKLVEILMNEIDELSNRFTSGAAVEQFKGWVREIDSGRPPAPPRGPNAHAVALPWLFPFVIVILFPVLAVGQQRYEFEAEPRESINLAAGRAMIEQSRESERALMQSLEVLAKEIRGLRDDIKRLDDRVTSLEEARAAELKGLMKPPYQPPAKMPGERDVELQDTGRGRWVTHPDTGQLVYVVTEWLETRPGHFELIRHEGKPRGITIHWRGRAPSQPAPPPAATPPANGGQPQQ